MVTVADILSFLESVAPSYMKEDWDNVGLNCGRTDKAVNTVLIALDPFEEVCREAKAVGADLLLTHHALLWKPGFITDQTKQGRNTLFLIENGIACINAHTNLDCAPGGVNDTLAKLLGLNHVEVMDPAGVDEHGTPWGLLRKGTVSNQTLDVFLSHVKKVLDCRGLRYADGGKPVQNVAVGGGACAGALEAVIASGCDTFITADVKYNQFWDARDLGLNLVDAGHFHTENPVCSILAEKIQQAFPEITVKLSKTHDDCMKFF